jgi:predicted dehydrogenase
VVRKLKEVLEEGRIGKILSAEVRAAGGLKDREVVPQGLEHFTRREVGGNVFAIGLGHRESSPPAPFIAETGYCY